MRRLLPVALLLLAPASAAAVEAPPAPPATPLVHRVLLVSVDGLRPDLLLRADAPAMRGLMESGCFTLWARTTPVSVTLPSHVSMLTGVSPEVHGIDWNDDRPFDRDLYPRHPTLFDLARRAGYTTAMVAGKAKFAALAVPGSLDWVSVPVRSGISDSAAADTACAWIEAHAPQVLFVHLANVDGAGHDFGWGSPGQLAAVAAADRCVGRLLAALAERGLADSTAVLVTADHGGTAGSHGRDDPRSRFIPWIAAGPGIRRDHDLTLDAGLEVRTEDTFATLCHLLGIEPAPPPEGRAVLQILERTPRPASAASRPADH